MIFGNSADIQRYNFLSGEINSCFIYMRTHNISDYPKGSYPVEKENIFVNIAEYKTKPEEKCFFEAHRKYIDVHYLISGEERIDINFIRNMFADGYNEEDDFLSVSGKAKAGVILHPGDFLICFPEDAHKTGICTDKISDIKKAVFKVRI